MSGLRYKILWAVGPKEARESGMIRAYFRSETDAEAAAERWLADRAAEGAEDPRTWILEEPGDPADAPSDQDVRKAAVRRKHKQVENDAAKGIDTWFSMRVPEKAKAGVRALGKRLVALHEAERHKDVDALLKALAQLVPVEARAAPPSWAPLLKVLDSVDHEVEQVRARVGLFTSSGPIVAIRKDGTIETQRRDRDGTLKPVVRHPPGQPPIVRLSRYRKRRREPTEVHDT